MIKKDIPELKELPVVDYSNLPKDVQDVIMDQDPHVVEKTRNISWDGNQFTMRIPMEISEELKITKDSKIIFRLIKPLPKSNEKIRLEVEII